MKRFRNFLSFRHGKTVTTEQSNHVKNNRKIFVLIFLFSLIYFIIDIIIYMTTDPENNPDYLTLMCSVVSQFVRLVLFFFYIRRGNKESSKKLLYMEIALIVTFSVCIITTWNVQIDLDPSRTYIVGIEAGWTFLYVHTLFGQWPWKAIVYISTSLFGIYKVSCMSEGFNVGIIQAILQIGFVLSATYIEEVRKRKKLLHSISVEKTEQTLRNILNSLPDNIAILNLQGDIRFYNDFFGISFQLSENTSSPELFSKIFQVKPRERHLNLQKIQERYNLIKPLPRKPAKVPVPTPTIKMNSLAKPSVKSTNNPLMRYLTEELELSNNQPQSAKEIKMGGRDQNTAGIGRAARFSRQTSLKTLTEFFSSINHFKNLQELLEFFCINVDIIRTYTEKEKSFFIFDGKYNTAEGISKCFEIKVSLSTFDNEESFILILRDTTHRDIIVTLEDNNNFKDSVLSSMSHELRTPLNTNLNLLQLTIDALDRLNHATPSSTAITYANLNSVAENSSFSVINDLKENYLVPAHKSGKLLESLINDVVDYSLLTAQKFIINMKHKYLLKSVEKIRYLCEFQARKKNLEFHISLSQELNFKVGTDHRRLRQILTNLVNNAIRFTNKGFVSLRIEPHGENSEFIKFSVKDSGIGIPPENLKRMVNLLESGNFLNKLNRESSGVGMGLIISQLLAKEIGPTVARMSGIKIESTPDEGSKFWFLVENWTKKAEHPVRQISDWARIHQLRSEGTYNDSSRLSVARRTSALKPQIGFEKTLLTTDNPLVDIQRKYSREANLGREDEVDEEIARMIKDDNLKMNLGERKLFSKDSNFPSLKNMSKLMMNISDVSAMGGDRKYPDISIPGISHVTTHRDPTSRAIQAQTPCQDSTEIREEMTRGCMCPEILVVDDDMFNLFTMENLFANMKFRIGKAINGEEAIKTVKRRKELKCCDFCLNFKLIFMDLSMPVMDGFEATKALKRLMRNQEIPEIPIVACTAFVDQDKTDKCYEVGMEGKILKPVNQNKLREVLKKYGIIEADTED